MFIYSFKPYFAPYFKAEIAEFFRKRDSHAIANLDNWLFLVYGMVEFQSLLEYFCLFLGECGESAVWADQGICADMLESRLLFFKDSSAVAF